MGVQALNWMVSGSNFGHLPASSAPMDILNELRSLLGENMDNLLNERKAKTGMVKTYVSLLCIKRNIRCFHF